MTKIAITPNASGTGTFTIAAPNSNDDRTFTLPDATGEVLTDQSNIEAQVKTATNATGSAPIYACRAWVNFSGTGTVDIRASGNVSSITDNGTGDYTVNFATAMSDADYSVCGFLNRSANAERSPVINFERTDGGAGTPPATTSVRLVCVSGTSSTQGGARFDPPIVTVAIFR